MLRRILIPITLLVVPAAMAEVQFPVAPRVGPNVFPIIGWSGTPTDPQQLQWMKEAGLNVTGFCNPEELDKVQAAGLTCIVSDPKISSIVYKNAGTDEEIREAVAALAKKIAHHPAAYAVNLRDEPGVEQMAILGRLAAELLRVMPDKLPYVNLFPNYATAKQLGAPSYEEYLRAYLRLVKLPYLSWDNYSIENGEMLPRFYDNLEVARKVTLEAGIPFWNCILATALFKHPEPSDATFNLQIYSTMAYGGRGIELFTYYSAEIGNFRMAPIDHYGNRTATWDALRRSAVQIHALAPTLVKLKSTGVYHWPVSTAAGTPLIVGLHSSGNFLVGEFVDTEGRPYVMLVNKSLKDNYSFEVVPRATDATLYRVSPVSGKESILGGEGNWLAPGAGVLFRIAAK